MNSTTSKTVRPNHFAAGLFLTLLAASTVAGADQTNPLDPSYYASRSVAQSFVGTNATTSAAQSDDGNPLRATYGWQRARPAYSGTGSEVSVVGDPNNPLSPQYRFR
jgi:hypothetical protein